MLASDDRGVVLKLVVALRVESVTDLCAAAIESSQHLNGRGQAVGYCFAAVMQKLEARFIDDGRPEHRRLRDLHRLVVGLGVVAARSQIEAADTSVADVAVREIIAKDQSVLLVELIINARADSHPALRRARSVRERIDRER